MHAQHEQRGAGDIVHVVGTVTDEVFGFLGPATDVLARAGRVQAIVMIDVPRYRYHVAALHETVSLILAPNTRNRLKQWASMLKSCKDALSKGGVSSLHLHGSLPCLVGLSAWAVWGKAIRVFIYLPQGSRSLRLVRAAGHLIPSVMRPLIRRVLHAVIVNVPQEAVDVTNLQPPDLIESPVRDVYLNAARNATRHPVIVAGGNDLCARNAELFAQLAVLLSGRVLQISFNWVGDVSAETRARFHAAGIGVFNGAAHADIASRLSGGWIYLATGITRGFPLSLVEAMAVGLPCVAFDCPQHREVIVDSQTGYLCETYGDMIERIATLLDRSDLRERMGEAARVAVSRRFTEASFSEKLLSAYAIRA